jgi:hypothetical protein
VTWNSWYLNLVFKRTSSQPRINRLPIYRSSWTNAMDPHSRKPRSFSWTSI